MSEPILKRMQRVVSAGLDSAAEAAERLNGGGIMRHSIRQVDQVIDEMRNRLNEVESAVAHGEFRQAAIRDEVKQLDTDARFAMDRGREDLAQVAVRRQFDLQDEARQVQQAQAVSEMEGAKLRTALSELAERKDEMERDYAALEAARREAEMFAGDPKADAKVKRAEEAFDRARRSAGAAPAVLRSVSQIDAIRSAQREEAIAERMDALRGKGDKKKPKA